MKFSAAIFASAVAALAAAPSAMAFAPAVSQIQKSAAAAAATSTLPSSTLFMAEDVSSLPLNCSLEHAVGQGKGSAGVSICFVTGV